MSSCRSFVQTVPSIATRQDELKHDRSNVCIAPHGGNLLRASASPEDTIHLPPHSLINKQLSAVRISCTRTINTQCCMHGEDFTAKTPRKQNPTFKGYLSLSCIPHCKAKHLLRSCFSSMLGKSMEPT